MRKITILVSYLIAYLIIPTFYNSVFAQNENYSVPAKWELYSVKDKNVSFLMPRLPVVIEQNNDCRGEQSNDYAAYTDGTVYILRIISKMKPSNYCSQKKNFDETNFIDRVKYVKSQLKDDSKTENNISENAVIKVTGAGNVVKLINDYANKRWFELIVYGADEKREEVKNFLASLSPEITLTGINIGKGAEKTYGDDSSVTEEVKIEKDGKSETVKRLLVKINDKTEKPVTVILKPRASYTELARQNGVQGKIVLRVTFKANGAISDISVISGLPQGLTEEAIKAARKLVFIPAQRYGARFSVTKPVEYTFAIY
jgi:TonB family protein